ncbi:MAG TPA: hypothetical protein ENJ95_21210 [Bacteroidetes bacterium]|nr:hypothetical protein [Bacteroidota bacterium]
MPAGTDLFYVNAGFSAYDGYIAFQNGDSAGITKSGFDLGFGAAATYGGLGGLTVGGIYFFIDNTMGWGPFTSELQNTIESSSKGLPPGNGNIFHSGGGHIGPKLQP